MRFSDIYGLDGKLGGRPATFKGASETSFLHIRIRSRSNLGRAQEHDAGNAEHQENRDCKTSLTHLGVSFGLLHDDQAQPRRH